MYSEACVCKASSAKAVKADTGVGTCSATMIQVSLWAEYVTVMTPVGTVSAPTTLTGHCHCSRVIDKHALASHHILPSCGQRRPAALRSAPIT